MGRFKQTINTWHLHRPLGRLMGWTAYAAVVRGGGLLGYLYQDPTGDPYLGKVAHVADADDGGSTSPHKTQLKTTERSSTHGMAGGGRTRICHATVQATKQAERSERGVVVGGRRMAKGKNALGEHRQDGPTPVSCLSQETQHRDMPKKRLGGSRCARLGAPPPPPPPPPPPVPLIPRVRLCAR
ncbi:hypothetical protein LZ31DRAFT_246547 [Colletotrichum somersetense]|nr:hypothetical protein LZ31DRAFT_246547 [Colletotrichum somersetense]